MEENTSGDIAVYTVWSPQLGAEERHVPDAASLMPDARATHYWDPNKLVGTAFGKTILPSSAPALWDFYMLFDRGAEWSDAGLPEPAWWSHQLQGLPPERRLDAARFATKATSLLEQVEPGPGASR